MSTNLRLEGFRDATIGADGTATVFGVGPNYPGEQWSVKKWSVTCSAPAEFRIVRGIDIDQRYQIDSTTRGDLDSSETNVPLQAGETVSFHWFNSTVGARATIRWEGVRTVPGNRGY